MFYYLDKKYRLAGWERVPYAVVERGTRNVNSVSKEIMEVLQMCEGHIDLDMPFFPAQMKQTVEALVQNGIIHPSETPVDPEPRQEYVKYNNRYIMTAHWSITGACNYKCKHCYLSAADAKYGQLSHEDTMRIVREIIDCGIPEVSLTGGEPLMRKDFMDIVRAFVDAEIHISQIYSNGRLVTKELLTELDKLGIHPEFNMSFDGTEGWHSWLRGVEGADEDIKRAFLLCKEMGFPTGAEMCVHERNKHTLRDSINTLAEWGCSSVKLNPICNTGAWKENGYGESIGYDELSELYYNYIKQYYEDGRPITVQLGGLYIGYPDGNYFIPSDKTCTDPSKVCTCAHARNVMYISPEGRTLPCMALGSLDIQNEFPSILEEGLAKCITSSKYLEVITTSCDKVIEHNDRCMDCEYRLRCLGGCRAGGLMTEPDDLLNLDEATCAMFKGGWVDKVKEIAEPYKQKYIEEKKKSQINSRIKHEKH